MLEDGIFAFLLIGQLTSHPHLQSLQGLMAGTIAKISSEPS